MTDEERTFARQSRFLTDAHQLADMALEIGGARAGALLLSAALIALDRGMGMDEALCVLRAWTESLEVDAWHDGSSGRH